MILKLRGEREKGKPERVLIIQTIMRELEERNEEKKKIVERRGRNAFGNEPFFFGVFFIRIIFMLLSLSPPLSPFTHSTSVFLYSSIAL